MGFFRDLKDWYDEQKKFNEADNYLRKQSGQPTKSLFSQISGDFQDIVVEPTKQDYKELKNDVKVDTIKFKNDVKKIIKEASPPVGDAVDKIDKVGNMIANGIEAMQIGNILKREFNFNQEFKTADHLYVQRLYPTPYTHHGIYLGDETVIHYANGTVEIVSINEFSQGATVNIKNSPMAYSVDEVIRRAKSRLGEGDYSVFTNNCEHFCNWCRNGDYA